MEYRRAYSHPFQQSNWIKTVLLLAVCILIPIVGVMVILGYRAEILDRWLDDGDDRRQKVFDFGRFSEQLNRGISPFLYQLIIGLAFGMVLGIMYVGLIILWITSKNQGLFLVGLAFFYLCLFVIQIFVKMIVWPFTLHGQITGKFEFGNAWRFAKDFYSRIGITNLAGIALCCMVLDLLVMIVGMMLFCIGMYPALAVMLLADNHILWQLYRRYLEKGGVEIPQIGAEEITDQPMENPKGDVN